MNKRSPHKFGELIPHELCGVIIGQRKSDGYFNAAAMCKAAGKRFNDYSRLAATVAFLGELASDAGIPVSLLVITIKGVTTGATAQEQGTWVHPKVAMNLAQWCSEKFAVTVAGWVYDWMTTRQVPSIQPVVDFSDPLVAARLYIEAEEGRRAATAQAQTAARIALTRGRRRKCLGRACRLESRQQPAGCNRSRPLLEYPKRPFGRFHGSRNSLIRVPTPRDFTATPPTQSGVAAPDGSRDR